MLPEEKNIRSVIKGCCERGVHISEELATVFVSTYAHWTRAVLK